MHTQALLAQPAQDRVEVPPLSSQHLSALTKTLIEQGEATDGLTQKDSFCKQRDATSNAPLFLFLGRQEAPRAQAQAVAPHRALG